MSTKTEQSQARACLRRRRKHAKADRRRRDRALVPVVVAARVGIPVAYLARAMRAAGVGRQLTEAEATGWICDPETPPEGFTTLVGERLVRAAEAEYRREQAAEQRQLRELAVEQSAWAKVQAGKRRFSDDEWVFVHDWAFRAATDLVRGWGEIEVGEFDRQVLRVVDVDADDHATWPIHAGGCEGVGEEHCVVRMGQMRAELVAPTTTLPTPPEPGVEVVLCDHGGHVRRARVIEVDGPLFEATYSLKSGQ